MSPITSRGRSLLVTIATAVAVVLGAVGCGGGLSVTKLSTVQGPPNNLAVFMAVERDGHPVTGLGPDDFTVYEDGLPVAKADARITLQPADVGAVTQTLILVDRSTAGAGAIPADALVGGVEGLAERAAKLGPVAVYAFDGEDGLHPILPFGGDVAGVSDLGDYKPKDASCNLNGAVVAAAEELSRALAQAPMPLRFGAVVVVSGGPDRAGRRTREDAVEALRDEKLAGIDVYAIGVGPGAAQADLADLGRAATWLSGPALSFGAATASAATAIEERWRRYYLLSYCTPARGGEHQVRVEVRSPRHDATGAVEYAFVADGMTSGCDAGTPPMFAGLDAPGERAVRLASTGDARPVAAAGPVAVAVAAAAKKPDAVAVVMAASQKALPKVEVPTLGKLGLPTKIEIPGIGSIGVQSEGEGDDDEPAGGGDRGSSGAKKDKSKKQPHDKKASSSKSASKKHASKPSKKK